MNKKISQSGRTLSMGESAEIIGQDFVQAPFTAGLLRAGARHQNMVVLTADLAKYTDIAGFRNEYPERFFNVGMAEQSLIMTAAGLSKVGKIAYCTTYGTFASRRAYDFIAIACAHSHENVKVFAGNPGLESGYGGTHQATEDLAMMRSIPGITVVDPADATEMEQIAEQAAEIPGTLYSRLLRGKVVRVFDPKAHQFRVGKAHVVEHGGDVGFISTGLMTGRCLDAVVQLKRRGIQASVSHNASIKPFDRAGLLEFVSSVKRVVVAENHVAIGGLASLVSDALYEAGLMRPLIKISIPDQFIECGSQAYLYDRYGLSTNRIVDRVAGWLENN